jgi:hypothetical protein
MINKNILVKSFKNFYKNKPINYCIIDNFFEKKMALKLEKEFPDFNSNIWHEYNNPLEIKKTCNQWNLFTPLIYQAFSYLNSHYFVSFISKNLKLKKLLLPDNGLHGGGLHTHKNGGKLNRHLDYVIHPKFNKKRKYNLIVYLNSKWKENWGGELGFWKENKGQPGQLIDKIFPKFNRAIFFDTSQNSWHGLVNSVKSKNNNCRISFAVYYHTDLFKSDKLHKRLKVLYAPDEKQKKNKTILNLIKKRSSIKTFYTAYKKK